MPRTNFFRSLLQIVLQLPAESFLSTVAPPVVVAVMRSGRFLRDVEN